MAKSKSKPQRMIPRPATPSLTEEQLQRKEIWEWLFVTMPAQDRRAHNMTVATLYIQTGEFG